MKKIISLLLNIVLIFCTFTFVLATDETSKNTTYFYTNESGEFIASDEYEYDENPILIENQEDYEKMYNNSTNQEEYKQAFEEQKKKFLDFQEDITDEKVVITKVLSDIKSEYTTDYYYYYIIKYQLVNIRTSDGMEIPAVVILSYDVADNKNLKPLKTGDTVYAYVDYITSEDETYNMINHGLTAERIAFVSVTAQDRSLGIILLTIFTILLLILYAGKHGTKLLIPMFVAIDLLFVVLIPELELGKNLLLLSSLIALELIILITVLKNGWSRKTTISIISSIIVVTLVSVLGYLFADTNSLTGKGLISEENYDLSTNVYYIDQLFKTTIDSSNIIISILLIITSVITSIISSKLTEISEKYAGTQNMISSIIEESKPILSEYPMIITIIFLAMQMPSYMFLTYNKTSFVNIINSEVLITNATLLLLSLISSIIIAPITAVISNLIMGEVEIKQIES